MKQTIFTLGLATALTWGGFSAAQEASSVTGIIYEDLNENGSFDESEPVTPGAEVALMKMASQKALDTAFTDEEGRYHFTDVTPGKYPLRIKFPDGRALLTEPLEVKVGGGEVFVSVPLSKKAGTPRFAKATSANPANTPQISVSTEDSAPVPLKIAEKSDSNVSTPVKVLVPPGEVMSPSAP